MSPLLTLVLSSTSKAKRGKSPSESSAIHITSVFCIFLRGSALNDSASLRTVAKLEIDSPLMRRIVLSVEFVKVS